MVELSEFYKHLREEQARLADDLKRLESKAGQSSEWHEGSPFGKREEEAAEAFELEKRWALENRLKGALAEVEHALDKYEAGTYGICDCCGKPIEPARLEVLPQASMCLACKTQQIKNVKTGTGR